MATLEKIRSRQKLLFGIVFVALVLFIFTAVDYNQLVNLFHGGSRSIAKAGDVQVEYNEYNQLIEQMNNNNNRQQDGDVARQQAIQQILFKKLLEKEMDNLGITVTEKELSELIGGKNQDAQAAQFISGLGSYLGLTNPTAGTVLDAIKNPSKYGMSKASLDTLAMQNGQPSMLALWKTMEEGIEQQTRQRVFGELYAGLFRANELDAKSVYNDNNTSATVSFVSASYSTVPDKDVEVTDQELKAKWEATKGQYKITEDTREIEYIVVPIVPSQADIAAANQNVDKMMAILSGTEDSPIPSYFMHETKKVPVSQLSKDADLRMIPQDQRVKDAIYRYPKANNTYRIAKINDVTMEIDSVNFSFFVTPEKKEADSIYNLVVEGKTTFKELAAAGKQAADSMWTNPSAIDMISEQLETLAVGQTAIYTDSLSGQNVVYRVLNRRAPVETIDVTLYKYELDPSAATMSDLKKNLSSYIATNNTEAKLAAAAENDKENNYNLQTALISASTPSIGYVPNSYGMPTGVKNSRKAIKWAMDAKKGEVSPVFTLNNDTYLVVAVKDIYEDDYMPYTATNVKEQLTAQVKADKKGDALVKKFQGKASDLAGYASQMNSEVRTDSNFVFTAPMISVLPGRSQYNVQGRVAAADKGKMVGPIMGENEVVVFVVNDKKQQARPYNFEQDGNTFMQTFNIKDTYSMLLGKNKVKNYTLELENYENE